MSTFGTVWVMGEDPESYAALCAVGRRVGERVEAVFIGTAADASRVQAQGADAVHVGMQKRKTRCTKIASAR